MAVPLYDKKSRTIEEAVRETKQREDWLFSPDKNWFFSPDTFWSFSPDIFWLFIPDSNSA